jgi:predicted ATPase/DNA-binding SARP family transcriptional activator
VQVSVLGPLEVRDDAGGLVPVAGARLRDLIARLALAGGRPVGTAALAAAVWGDDSPADLANALQTLVSRARRTLGGAAAVEQSAAGYRLAVTPDDVDALQFERLAAQGAVAQALALWRGPALGDVGDFAAPHAARLHALRLDALVTHITGEVDAGRAAAHVAELESLVTGHPLDEKLTALLMRALAATGRQADALAAHEALRARLADELGIDPGAQVQAAHLEVLRGEVPPVGPPSSPARPAPGDGLTAVAAPAGRARTNLRISLTSFIGREHEVARVGAALDTYRLVTLVGPGGAGKTRLAAEVAAEVAGRARDAAPDGVWMAELASVTDAADVAPAVLGSVGLREARVLPDGAQRITSRDAQSRLLDGLADAHALLVLDNCEHLIDACAHLADMLLAHSPRLRIVATSREPLGITGESLFVVPPLEQDPAVLLFADRAAAVSPGFELNAQSLPLVVDIVRRLDGLPLAIELAAARLRTLPLAEISRRLTDRFRLLTGGSRTALPRHRTLRAVVEWSWDLLTPAERLLAERFSVFPAGATPAAVAQVCGDAGLDADADADELLSSLVDKSLLQPVPGGTRMRMLETIREFGSEKLAGRGEIGALRERHARYYSGLMSDVAPHLLTREQLTWLPVVQAERDNILGALRYWGDAADADQALALALWACVPALLLGRNSDISSLLAQALDIPGAADEDLRTIVEAMHVLTSVVGTGEGNNEVPRAGDVSRFAELADRVDAVRTDRYPFAGLLRPLFALFGQDREKLRRYVDETLASEDEWLVAATWMVCAAAAENDGDVAGMRVAGARGLERFRALGERWGLSGALRIDGEVRLLDGDLDGAAAAYAEAAAVLSEIGSHDDELHMGMRQAGIAMRRGDYSAARELFAAAWQRAEEEAWALEQAIVATWYGMFEFQAGEVERARNMYATAEVKFATVITGLPVRHHVHALMQALGVEIAIADDDLALARERAAVAYGAAVQAQDMPLLASVAWSLADLAIAAGQPERAARMLGAAAAVRGAEDPGEPAVIRLAARLRAALEAERYASAYAAGRQMDRAEAIKHLDPACL